MRWWSVRNKFNQGERGWSTDEVAADVLNLIDDLSNKERQQPMRCEVARKRWIAPPQDLLKINADGSFIPESMQGSWGFVVRDHDGEAVLGRGWMSSCSTGCSHH
jgi:hypothetical protein